ncbi:MAG: aromatic-ring-hydroxylating dioxygenase, beta subunit [Nocardioides sp.]|jgi:3-phenylpropionate/cinnamic acid dioxygenase small subunit|uniref:3-phenylpropionate/cinnamic acid dioxygenase subunit beta n=1 Tax=Nocardioides sp. TaxID=35761 RepID=UPI002612EA24|nr:3-phenylpropionate/cinnamic acid dioxygenase subunit beta [Nocardioides sp.]MCW2835025.1 aromatic-ring-hydroxylating dioxygenase, beta subunit [Nocardioides sp.]
MTGTLSANEGQPQFVNETGLSRAELRDLLADVSDFLYREADLLDERRYTEWLDLLADDYRYTVPLRMNVPFQDVVAREETKALTEVCWFDEPKDTQVSRVMQLMTGVHWAEEPVSRVSHLVTNLRLKRVALPEVEVSSRFLVYRNRVSDETDIMVGRRTDILRQVGEDWQVVKRTLLLDQSVLMAKNLSIFI